MLDLKEIDKEIEKLENCNMTYSVCQKLASMYIIKDHWERRETKVSEPIVKEMPTDWIAPAKEDPMNPIK